MIKKIYALGLFLSLSIFAQAQIQINEYSCSNINTTLDAFGQYEDWVEIYNSGASAVNLTGYYLSDDPTDLMKFQIPAIATSVNSNDRQMIFASGRGVVNGAQIHPDFKLTQTKGEWFIISDPSGTMVDSVHLNVTQRSHSRGRTTDGAATWSLFTTPTSNASNAGSTPYDSYATKPVFSLSPGFYNVAQTTTITSPDPNVTIRYTLDGSTPIATSPIYSTPINIAVGAGTVGTVVRAVAFSSIATIVPSFTESNSYFTNETTTMNIISITGAMNTLFGGASQPFVSYEYFDKNRVFIEEFEGRARRHGHDSWAYPQKGFKIYPVDELGYQANYKHKYFRTSLRDEFDVLLFKAGASDNYNGNGGPSCHLRDAFAHTLSEKYNLDMDFRRYEPTIIYINGVYWGVYEIRERVDKDHKKYYYGKKESNLDQLQNWGGLTVTAGSAQGWTNLFNFVVNNNMALPANYAVVKDSFNVNSFCQYMIFNQYLVNSDWLNWNSMWWRARGTNPIKWRYALWDEDNILDLGQNYTGLGSTTFNNDPCNVMNIFQGNNVGPNNGHAKMMTRLLDNTEFKALYDQTWIDLLNGPLECSNMMAHFDSIRGIITPEMPRQIARWGGSVATWNANITYMASQITGRCAVIAAGLADTNCIAVNPQKLKLNVSPAGSGTIAFNGSTKSPYVFTQTYKADSIYNLKATPAPGYWIFDHWEKQNVLNGIAPNTTTDLIQLDFQDKDSVIAFFKYFNPDSLDVTFDVNPAGTGTISWNGNLIPVYPTTIKLDRRFTYDIVATPIINHKFIDWTYNNTSTTISPNVTEKVAKLTFDTVETVVANFQFVPPPPPPPPLPQLTGIDKRVFIPNVFSPNLDGKNDLFNVKVGKDAIGLDITIFDRWGNQVFQTSSLSGGWDGKIKDRNADIATYQYFIRVKFRDNSIENYKGDLSLIR